MRKPDISSIIDENPRDPIRLPDLYMEAARQR